jgi:hypothetical protein
MRGVVFRCKDEQRVETHGCADLAPEPGGGRCHVQQSRDVYRQFQRVVVPSDGKSKVQPRWRVCAETRSDAGCTIRDAQFPMVKAHAIIR